MKPSRTPEVPEPSLPRLAGIGASAGGIPALRSFFECVPENSGIAFVVVMHLSPEHESNLAEVLQPFVKIPVRQVKGRTPLEPDHVYVIPPGRSLKVSDGHMEIAEFEEPRGRRAPIDIFFRTVAESHPDGIGILLSGSGTDGVVGMKAIKESGGVLLAQSPDEAEYPTMPQAAVATGLVDFVLPARELGAKVVELRAGGLPWIRQQATESEKAADALARREAETLGRILSLLKARTGHDFGAYNESTVLRRVDRRMRVNQSADLPTYLEFVQHNPAEAQALMNDLLISVTRFFRDLEAFEALRERVIPGLLEAGAQADPVRIWVPGCATGEEAYSIAMLVLEEASRRRVRPFLQVFASDLDEEALAHGRHGVYPEAIVADVSDERLERFFTREGPYYRIREDLREVVIFAAHDLLRDPPFSRLDLVSCRNLLIYLRRELQEKVFELFHYALREGGRLFLGSSESADGGAGPLFRALDKECRIYARKSPSHEARRGLPELPLAAGAAPVPSRPLPRVAPERAVTDAALHRDALETRAPPSLLVDDEHSILHVSATAHRYLRFPAGSPTSNLLKLARKELLPELRAGLFQALEKGRATRSRWIPLELEGQPRRILLHISPAEEGKERGVALVVFLEAEPHDPEDVGRSEAADASRARESEEEMARLKEWLQQTIEQSEDRQAELRSANEELQSINEEYKSTVEELETSREELQSLNEELETVNEQLNRKVDELSRANADLENLTAATEIATLFLDRELRVQRFTPALERIFNVLPADGGRPVSHVTHDLDYEAFSEDCRGVLRTLRPTEREVSDGAGNHFLARILPYRADQGQVAGIVATFTDVGPIRRAQERLRRSEERLRLLIEGMREYAIFSTDPQGRITLWNPGAERIFGFSEEEAIGQPAARLFTPEDREAGVPEAEMRTAADEGQARHERWHVRQDGSRFWASGTLTTLYDEDGELRGFAKVLRDNTERREREEALRRSEERLRRLNERLEERVAERTAELEEAQERMRRLASELMLAEQRIRRQVAHQLHDDLQQRLYALQMKLPTLRALLQRGAPEKVEEALEQAEALVGEAARMARRITVDLSPRTLRDEGFMESLSWLVEQMRELHELEVEVRAEEAFDIRDEDVRTLVFQSVQELLFNVVKHADVPRAVVELAREEGARVVRTMDGGRGFDVGAARSEPEKAFGLFTVRERMSLIGGALEIESAPGQGARITIRLPDEPPRGSKADD